LRGLMNIYDLDLFTEKQIVHRTSFLWTHANMLPIYGYTCIPICVRYI